METYISIVRGINVGGHRMINMNALKKMCSELNFTDIRTYVQSGNIVFKSKQTNIEKINALIQLAIKKEFGFDVPVITMTQGELEKTILLNPFIKNKSLDPSFFHVTFLSSEPTIEHRKQLTGINLKNDKCELSNRVIYLYCPEGYSNSKLTNSFFENRFQTTATTRNWRTINELFKLAIH